MSRRNLSVCSTKIGEWLPSGGNRTKLANDCPAVATAQNWRMIAQRWQPHKIGEWLPSGGNRTIDEKEGSVHTIEID